MQATPQPFRIVFADPGIDDALALILLESALKTKVDAIVSTGGNVPASQAARNCAWLKSKFGLAAPLFAGTDPPPGPVPDAAHVHGPWGLGEVRAPAADLPPFGCLLAALERATGPLDMLVLSPATDAAKLACQPALAARLSRVVAMAGAFAPRDGRLGNVTPYAEFNAYMDPEALWALCGCGAQAHLVPLDATESRLLTLAELLPRRPRTEAGVAIAELLTHLEAAHVRLGAGRGVFLHDVMAAGIWAGAIPAQWREVRLREPPSSGVRRGVTARNGPCGRTIKYAATADMDKLLSLWQELMARHS